MELALNGSDMAFFRKIQAVWLALALLASLIVAGAALAQTQTGDRSEARDIRRVERQVDDLSKAHSDLKFDIEKRLTKIETYVTAGAGLLSTIVLLLIGQLGKNLLDLIAVRRSAQAKE